MALTIEKAKTAKAEYEKAFAELGLELSNKPLLADASAATGALRTVGEELRRATAGGEKLKAEREWIEVSAGTEADAILSESISLQEGGDQ